MSIEGGGNGNDDEKEEKQADNVVGPQDFKNMRIARDEAPSDPERRIGELNVREAELANEEHELQQEQKRRRSEIKDINMLDGNVAPLDLSDRAMVNAYQRARRRLGEIAQEQKEIADELLQLKK